MRSFIAVCVATIPIAVVGAIGRSFMQEPVSVAFPTQAVRL